MYCLLCHEKIPRLRAWRTKSEFCCDEHAALYKKQTLERLLVDPGVAQHDEQASLPEPPDPDEFENDEAGFDFAEEEPATPAADAGLQPGDSDPQAGLPNETMELPPPADLDSGDGADELWRLATEVEHEELATIGYSEYTEASSSVKYQTAEEALEALRRLASRATPPPEDEPAFGQASVDEAFDEHDVLREIEEVGDSLQEPDEPVLEEPLFSQPLSEGPVSAEPEETPVEPAELQDLEEDLILDDLLADPPQPVAASQDPPDLEAAPEPLFAAEPFEEQALDEQPQASADAGAALRALVDSLENDAALTEEELQIDLDVPEPDWASDHAASSELSALEESLYDAGAGSSPEPVGAAADRLPELSPDEPEWDAMSALELDEQDVDPPMPDLGDELPLEAAESAPFPEALEEVPERAEPKREEPPAAKAALNGAGAAPKKSFVRKPATRFRPITTFVEIRIELATWPPESRKHDYSAEPAPVAGRADVEHGLSPLGPHGAGLPASGEALETQAGISAAVAAEGGANPVDAADILPPQPSEMYLPPGLVSGTGRNVEWNMYEDSVDLEPAPVLEISSAEELEPALIGVAAPFEPEGLFFDLAGGGLAKDA